MLTIVQEQDSDAEESAEKQGPMLIKESKRFMETINTSKVALLRKDFSRGARYLPQASYGNYLFTYLYSLIIFIFFSFSATFLNAGRSIIFGPASIHECCLSQTFLVFFLLFHYDHNL